MARVTGLEPAASGVTGQRSNQLSYTRLCLNKARLLARRLASVNGFYTKKCVFLCLVFWQQT